MADTTKMIALERSLAFDYAVSLVEGCCDAASVEDFAGDCYNLDSADELCTTEVREAAEYLDWRGLLTHVADKPHIVSITDEDFADHPLDKAGA